MRVVTPPVTVPHFPPKVSVKLREVIKLSDRVMSIQVGVHEVIHFSGLTVPQSKVKLANILGKGYLLLHR